MLYHNFRFSPPLIVRRTLEKVIKEFGPEVIHIQGHFFICANVAIIGRKFGIPVVGTNHFMPDNLTPYLHLPDRLDNLVHKLAWMHFRSVFNKLDFATSPTKAAGDILKSVGFKKEVRPVTNGVDLKMFNAKNNGDYLKERYKVPQKDVLLFVGRLDHEKNIDWIIEALSIALKKVDIHFVIAGGGSQEENLKNLVGLLGLEKHVTFTGVITDQDLPYIYGTADCFVMAATAELQSLATMEAMASGLPVIAANARALPELVVEGKNGYLFEPGDTKQLADIVVRIFENPALREEMGKSSLKLIRKHDINKSVGEFEEIYRSLQKKDEVRLQEI